MPVNVLPYDIELDDGTYCRVRVNEDGSVRCLKGAPVLIDPYPVLSDDLALRIDEELSDMLHCGCAMAYLQLFSKINRHRCSACGKASKDKELRACTRCKLSTYCNTDCQKAHYKEHHLGCKKLAAYREKFSRQLGELDAKLPAEFTLADINSGTSTDLK